MFKKISIFCGLVCLCWITASCTETVKSFGYMDKLRDTLSKKFETKQIGINIRNNRHITVSFINSKFNQSSRQAQGEMAYEVGKVVLATLEKNSKITGGHVAFVANKSYLIFNSSSSSMYDMRLDSLSKANPPNSEK